MLSLLVAKAIPGKPFSNVIFKEVQGCYMILTITLPDSFKEHFEFDRFQDSFARICGDIRAKGGLSGNYEHELACALKAAFKNCPEISERN
jgi:hypothetical protein